MDSQTLELIGRHRLIEDLLAAGLEVALPLRDRGVDLLVYRDLDVAGTGFCARPLQLKASSARGFGIARKYEKFPDLLIVHVWNLQAEEDVVVYATTYSEVVGIGDALGWTRTKSWIEKGGYSTRNPNGKLIELLDPFKMTPETWRERVVR